MNIQFSNQKEFDRAVERDKARLSTCQVPNESSADGRTQVFRMGEGESVIFVPMLGELNFLFVPSMQLIAEKFSAITYVPSVSAHNIVTPGERAAELARVIEDCTRSPVHLVSWSDTAAATCRLMETRPDLVRSASFVAVPDCYRFPFPINLGLWLLYRLPLEKLPIKRLLLRNLGELMGGKSMPSAWVQKQAADIDSIVKVFKLSCLPCIVEHKSPDTTARKPALVIGGDDDKVTSPAQSERFAKAIGAEFIFLEGGDHFPTYTNPVTVSCVIKDFINNL